jgi:hypothetical protein
MGYGDSPWWVIWGSGCLLPMHVYRLFFHAPYERNFILPGAVQGAVLVLYAGLAFLSFYRCRSGWARAGTLLGYPVVVMITNAML